MSSLLESLTENFYRWEKRGRGGQGGSSPVELEPPFQPFYHQYVRARPPIDDAHKPTVFSSLAEKVIGRHLKTATIENWTADLMLAEAEPRYSQETFKLVHIKIK